ncbi:hypothetical protein EU537_04710 [Candidatus Thorarchaeota archaeon]|nr:MAG: hypothetical protein EU537_04710 [Candidatus Thorarchaeota archaeon]
MSLFRRIIARLKGKKEEKEEKSEDTTTSETTQRRDMDKPKKVEKPTPESKEVPAKAEPPKRKVYEDSTPPDGSILASSASFRVNTEETKNLAEEAKIGEHSTAEMVPGYALKRDDQGRIHIKIVFYGPSLSGKTTALRWLFSHVRSLSKGKLVEIADDLGRTTFFDFVPVTASEKIVFDVFTVAGQRRHARQRINVLRDADGIIFMADSRPEMTNENLASLEELKIALGTDRIANMPIVVSLNKRDLPNALPVDYMVDLLDVDGYPVFPTIATEGKNLLRMFQRILRDSLIFRVGL